MKRHSGVATSFFVFKRVFPILYEFCEVSNACLKSLDKYFFSHKEERNSKVRKM